MGGPIPSCPFTCSASAEELVWGDGVGRWCWQCVVGLCGADNVDKWLVVIVLLQTDSAMC